MNIGFIGTGVMGASMVRNLLKNGHNVSVYNRTASKAKALEEDGAKSYETISGCIENCDVIITIVGYPKDVEEVYGEIIPNAKKGAILIDMTTSSPRLASELYAKAKENGLDMLDAPVSGGDTGAKNATLTIMCGGDRDTYEKALPIFEAMGKTFNYMGKAGSGQHTKMANQIAIAGAIAGAMEAMTYAIRVGLDINTALKAISGGAAYSFQLDMASKKVLDNDYEPGFFIKHFIKDMQIAETEAERRHLVLPVLSQVLSEYEELDEKGYGDLGTQALYKYYMES